MWNASQLLACHLVKTCFAFFFCIKPPWARQAVLCSPCALCGRCECACLQTLACRSFLCTTSGWCPPTTAASCLEGPAGPAWRREGGPSVPSLGHLAAQRGRGRGGRWRRGRGSTGKKRHFPSSLSLSLSFFGFFSSTLFFLSFLSLSPASWVCFHWFLYSPSL